MNQANKKIIIFDDDEDILSICTYILEEQGVYSGEADHVIHWQREQ